jgi:protocatechuate 3,4-dioxygenase beta subunit
VRRSADPLEDPGASARSSRFASSHRGRAACCHGRTTLVAARIHGVRHTWIAAALLAIGAVAVLLGIDSRPTDPSTTESPSVPKLTTTRLPSSLVPHRRAESRRDRAEEPTVPAPDATASDALEPSEPLPIVVRVTDDAGAPVAGVMPHVAFDPSAEIGDEGAQYRLLVTGPGPATGEDGISRIRRIGVPTKVGVAFPWSCERCFLPVVEMQVQPDQTELHVVLHEGVWVRGRLIDEHEQPVPSADVELTTPDGFTNSHVVERSYFSMAAPRDAVCDIRIARGPGKQEYEGTIASVRAGTTDVVLRCRKIPRDRRLAVLVLDPDGAPYPDADVWIRRPSGRGHARTRADGRCDFDTLPAVEYSVQASALNETLEHVPMPSAPALVVPSGQEIVLKLRRSVLLRGVVSSTAGQVIPGAFVQAKTGAVRIADATADKEGRFQLKLDADRAGALHLRASVRIGDPGVAWVGTLDVALPCDHDVMIVASSK